MLHIINKSPFQTSTLATCLRMAQGGDALLLIEDAETGELEAIDTGSASVRKGYADEQKRRAASRDQDLRRYGVAPIRVATDARDYAGPLLNYFRIRARRADVCIAQSGLPPDLAPRRRGPPANRSRRWATRPGARPGV